MNYGDTSIDNVSIDIHDSVVVAPVINVTLQLDGEQADEDESDDLFDDDDDDVTGPILSFLGVDEAARHDDRVDASLLFTPTAAGHNAARIAELERRVAELRALVEKLAQRDHQLHERIDALVGSSAAQLAALTGRIEGLRQYVVKRAIDEAFKALGIVLPNAA